MGTSCRLTQITSPSEKKQTHTRARALARIFPSRHSVWVRACAEAVAALTQVLAKGLLGAKACTYIKVRQA